MQASDITAQKNPFLLLAWDSLYVKSVQVFFAHTSSTAPFHKLSPVGGGSKMSNPITTPSLYSQLELKAPEYSQTSEYPL